MPPSPGRDHRLLTIALMGIALAGSAVGHVLAQSPPSSQTAPAAFPDIGPVEAAQQTNSPAPFPPAQDSFVPTAQKAATASVLPDGGPLPLPDDKRPLTLADCFRLAAVRSDTLKITAQDVFIAKTQWSQSFAQLLPTVTLSHNEHFQNQVQNSFLPPTPAYSSSGGITATQTLFNGGQNYNSVGAASQTVEAKKQTLRYSYQTLYQDVATAFYQTLIDAGQIVLSGDQLHDLDARAAELDRRIKLSRSRPAELLLAQADLASTRVSLEQQKEFLNVDRELLAFYIGIPADRIFLRDDISLPSAENIETYLRTLDFRPDILSQISSIRASERNLSAAQGQLWPTITAQLNWTPFNNPTSSSMTTPPWLATFSASLPIFDGGLIIAQINEQRALLRQSQFNLESLQRTGDQQVRTAFANFNGSAAQYLQNRQYTELSALDFNAQLDDYRHGITSNLNVLTALQSYHTARQQLHTSEMNIRLNFIKLHVAAGNAPTEIPATVIAGKSPIPQATP